MIILPFYYTGSNKMGHSEDHCKFKQIVEDNQQNKVVISPPTWNQQHWTLKKTVLVDNSRQILKISEGYCGVSLAEKQLIPVDISHGAELLPGAEGALKGVDGLKSNFNEQSTAKKVMCFFIRVKIISIIHCLQSHLRIHNKLFQL